MLKFFINVLVRYLKRDELKSVTLRKIFKAHYGIDVGLYSYGCFDGARVNPGRTFGRYCSISSTSRFLGRNHGVHFLSLHPYFYNEKLGFVDSDMIGMNRCHVGDDVWVGDYALILPSVDYIGRGAIVGAGSVVTKNVPPYAIVAGNPAKVIRYRFEPHVIDAIEKTQWWLMEEKDLKNFFESHRSLFFSPKEYLQRG